MTDYINPARVTPTGGKYHVTGIQPEYPALPTCDRLDNEPIAIYGLRVIKFILETNVTATLTDDALEAASYSIMGLQTFKVVKASNDYSTVGLISDIGLAKFAEVGRLISVVQKGRRQEEKDSKLSGASKVYKDGIAANPSSPVPLAPKPKTNPPAPITKPEPIINF